MAQVASDDLLTCERCDGLVTVEAADDGKTRVRCKSCGHTRDGQPQSQTNQTNSKWTVIAPDGQVMTFGSWAELIEARRAPPTSATTSVTSEALAAGTASPGTTNSDSHQDAKNVTKKASPVPQPTGAALLDLTPTGPAPAKLALAEESDANVSALLEVAKKAPSDHPVKAQEQAPTTRDAAAIVDDNSDDEPAPLSLRDAIADEEPAPLSLKDAVIEEETHETLSLRDMVVVPPFDETQIDSTPPPPARGALRTLPPTPSGKGNAAPPPTITVEDTEAKTETKAERTASEPPKKNKTKKSGASDATRKANGKKSQADAETKSESEKPKPRTAKKPDAAKSKDTSSEEDTAKTSRRAIASARPEVEEEQPKRGWVAPALGVAAAAVLIWRIVAGSPSSSATDQATTAATPTAATTATTATPTETTATTPTAMAPSASAAPAASEATPATSTAAPTEKHAMQLASPANANTAATTEKTPEKAAPEKTGTEKTATEKPVTTSEKKAAVSTDTMSMSELLDRAGSARRSGDYATARELYERILKQNPGNVEANGGLGDVARAQGDLNGAKTSYERALATSPSYGPAQLGLADTEWDLGNHAAAQRRYAQIVERLGERAPERVKQRSTATE